MAKKLVMLILTFLIISLCFGSVRASSPNIDRVAVVTKVYDGDTFVIDNNESIRFADVDTPEENVSGYQQAKNFVTNLVLGKTVYLDIDNLTTTDQYGRFVSVVYFDYNLTHYENLNKALLVENLAVVYDFSNNDFIPSSWSLFESKTSATPNPSPTRLGGPTSSPTPPDTTGTTLALTALAILVIIVISSVLYVRYLKKTITEN